MQKNKLLKRIISAALSMTLGSQLIMTALPASIFAVSLNTDFVIYSDEDVTINTNKAVLNGDVFSGDEFTYLGNDTCYVNKTLNADSKKGNINASQTVDVRTKKPDYTSQLRNGVEYRAIYSGDTVINAAKYDLHEYIYSTGKLRIDRTVFSGKGYVRARNSINYNAVQNEKNSEIFLYSEKGNITLQGADLTIDGILYAPNGTVELNAKNLTFNGTIVAKNVEFNGTNLTVNEIKDKSTSLIEFGPDLAIKTNDESYKENRKITLDISQSYDIDKIDISTISWHFTAESYENTPCIKIDETTSTELVKNLIITKKGNYRVTISARDKDGNNVNYYDVIEVVEDMAPVAGFYKDVTVSERDENGKAYIELEDTSYSLDGDEIGSRVWSVLFDSDNDGDFSDEKEEVFHAGNDEKVVYEADSVGKYRFKLSVAEKFEDTIPSLVSDDAYKTANTDRMDADSTVVEVLNEAPKSYSGLSKAKNVDIVVTVGNAEVEDIDTLNKNIKKVKEDLESKGYSVNLSTVSTSTLTAKDTFAWDEYDHFDYRDSYVASIPRHILYEEDSIRMVGYGWAPLRDWLFVDDGVEAKRILSFDMIRDRTDWHSMEGGGFLFNTNIYDQVQPTEDENAEPKTIKKLDGYCILLTSGGFKLIQFDDLDVEAFRNGSGSSAQAVGKVLMSVPVANVYDSYNIKIVASSRILSIFINDEPVIESFVLPDAQKGTGFGPIICHSSHGCYQQSYFTFSNIKMTTVNGSELSDVLDNFKWRDSAEHYVVNLSKQSVFDLNNEESVGSAVKSLIEKKTNFIGLGTSDSKSQYDLLLRSADGTYMDWYDVLKDEELLRKFILSDLSGVDYSVGDMISTSDELAYKNSFVDKENDPVGDQVWQYELNASVYENSTGKTGSYNSDKPLTTFEATGLYAIKSKLRDDPTKGNSSLDQYKEWSDEVKWTDGLYVHSLPTASISSEIFATEDPNKFVAELTFDAQDVDCLSHANKGITAEKFEWKCVDDSEWQEGTIPTSITPEKVYLQKYMVRDEQGAWSKPCIEIVYAEKKQNSDMFKDDEPPVVYLTVSDENPSVDDTILISVSAKDNTEVAYVRTTIDGKPVAEFAGSFTYECKEECEFEVVVECCDIAGNKTIEKKTVTVTDRRDVTAPFILVDCDNGLSITQDKIITVKGYIYDETAFGYYTAEFCPEDSDDYQLAVQSPNEVNGDVIAVFQVPDVGKYKFRVTAVDQAGNKSYDNILLNVTLEEFDKTQGEQTSEAHESPEHVDTPAAISIKASKTTAEVGEVVIVTVEAADKDGLTAVKIFKDDALIAEAPAEFRFTEAEAKVVNIRVETEDSYGGKSEKNLEIIFEDHRDKVAPTAKIASPEQNAEVSGKVKITGDAFDETGMRLYTLEYKKTTEKSFKSICSSYSERRDTELGVWDTYSLDNGVYDLRLVVTDNGGNITTYVIQVSVLNGAVVDDDKLNEDLIVFTKPEPNVKADDVIKVEAKVSPEYNGKEYEITIKGTGDSTVVKHGTIGNDGEISAAIDSSMLPDGAYTITVAVKSTDKDGKDNSAKKDTTAVVKHNYKSVDGQYDCEITSPEDMDEVKFITDIHAKVSEYVFTKYKFEYSEASKNDYSVFASGDIRNDTDIVGEFDASLLSSGFYDIRFTAYGDGIMASDVITLNVEDGIRIGNFSISFDDIETEINGFPLTITSIYDSRSRMKNGTLGYGWNLTYNSIKLSVSTNQSKNWATSTSGSSFITRYSLAETKKHRIKIDLGNGETEEFVMKISPDSQVLYPLQYGLNVYYKSTSESGSTLVPADMSPSDLIYNGGVLFNDDAEAYDPQRFIYTRVDGSKYELDANKGLISYTTPDGDKLTFSDSGITCSGKKFITFKKDSAGRIINISTVTGKEVSYEYDVFGDLISATDVLGNKRTCKYKDHYLTEYIKSDGVRVIKNEYDEDGRLAKATDADGNDIVYGHDVEGREETVKDRNGGITRVIYDSDGNALSKTDQLGNTTYYTYDNKGMMTSMQDALGYVTTYKFNADGKLLESKDAEGIVRSQTYNSFGLIQSTSVMGVEKESYAYDNKGRLLGRTDAEGNTTEYTYSGSNVASITDSIGSYVNITYKNGKPVSAKNGDGTECTYTYDADGNCTSRTVTYIDENGVEKQNIISYTYDAAGRVVSTVDTDGNSFKTEYNESGKIASETDKNGAQTRYTYDKVGNLVTVTYPDNTRETFTYDKNGNKLTAVDRMGRKAEMTYDKAGNLISKTYAGMPARTYKYDANYRLIEETAPNGAVTRYEYDKIGRNTAVINAMGERTEYTYDYNSAVTSMKDPAGNVYKYTNDKNGRTIRTDYPDGTYTETEYNVRGLVSSKTDQYGRKISYTYDALNRLASVTDALGGKTTYEYDDLGNLIKQTDANGNASTYSYDALGRLLKSVNAMGQSAEYTYDKNGNILTFTDFGGKTISFTYDSRTNRLTSSRADKITTSYYYTNDGAISSVSRSGIGTTTYTYDSHGQLTQIKYANGKYIEYVYDEYGKNTAVKTENGTTSYVYDLLGRVVSATDRNGIVTKYEYDERGSISEKIYSNGLTAIYDYDELGRIVSEVITDDDDNVVASYYYTLGKAGEITHIQELDRDVYYEYDELLRLVSEKIVPASDATKTYTYTYDKAGNRTSKTVDGSKSEYKYNALNQLVSGEGITYLYDASGNLTSAQSAGSVSTYTYNAENMLIEADVNGTVEEYIYDYSGNRISKKSGESYTYYLIDPMNNVSQVLEELNADGTLKCRYTRGNGLVSQERSGVVSTYLCDAHDSVRMLTDTNGNITDRYSYDAWGNRTETNGNTENERYYCGEQFDDTTGLYYLRARYMSPKTGTFTSLDTYQGNQSSPITLNKYLYANANPVMYSDPTGHFAAALATIGFNLAISFMVERVWSCFSMSFDTFFANTFCSTDWGSVNEYLNSDTTRYGTFEELYTVNQYLIQANFELASRLMVTKSLAFMKSELTSDYGGMISGSMSLVSCAKTFGDSITARYRLYDFIFAYAEGGDYMEELVNFTNDNITNIVNNFQSLCSDLAGDFGPLQHAYNLFKTAVDTVKGGTYTPQECIDLTQAAFDVANDIFGIVSEILNG